MVEKNKMNKVEIEKVVLSMGVTGDDVEKGLKLLKLLSGKKPVKTFGKKRVPALGITPGMEVGCMVTLRGGDAEKILERLLTTIDNVLKEKQISKNTFSFGIEEYIEIPGIEYQREIGVMGLDVTVSFYKKGKRISRRRIQKKKLPERKHVSKEEIIAFLENKYNTEIMRRNKK